MVRDLKYPILKYTEFIEIFAGLQLNRLYSTETLIASSQYVNCVNGIIGLLEDVPSLNVGKPMIMLELGSR